VPTCWLLTGRRRARRTRPSFFSRQAAATGSGGGRDERVTILSDPAEPELLQVPFTSEGEPIGRTVWIENGVVRNLAYNRFWAVKQGVAPRPQGGGILMSGTEATLDQLIAQVDRGLLVTRFWYIRSVDPRTITIPTHPTAATDRARQGGARGAVPVQRERSLLRNLVALGTPERVTSSESGGLGGTAMVVPPIVTREFNFTSVSEAV
jgi:predicted Zn-dependent protease